MKKRCPLLFFAFFAFFVCFTFFISVMPPACSLAAAAEEFSLSGPADSPYPGETVDVRLSPVFDAGRYGVRWQWEGGADNFTVTSGDAASYEARESAAVVSAEIWDRLNGEVTGSARLEIPSRNYAVSIRILTSEDVVQLWDEDAKEMTDRLGRATGSKVELEAAVDLQPAGELRYVWTHDETVARYSDAGNKCAVSRETTGPVVVSLDVFNQNNVRLGGAEIAFEVDISSEEQERSLKLNMGWERWKDALALREKGEAENALIQARQAFEELTAGGMKDDALRAELDRFRQVHENYFRSLEQASVAASLWRDGKPEEALDQYRQARTLYAHTSIEKTIGELEETLKRAEESKAKAASLADEARVLADGGDLDGAFAKYNESLVFYSSGEVRAALAGVEGRRRAIARRRELAETVRQVGLSLEVQENFDEALSKMAEAAEIWDLPDIAPDMERLASKIAERQRLRDEAGVMAKEAFQLELKGLEGQGDLETLAQALEKYRQAAELWKDDAADHAIVRVAAHAERIKDEIGQAAFLVKEAELLLQDKRFDEALDRYYGAQALRREDPVAAKISEVEGLREARRRLGREAEVRYLHAEELERQGELDEALASARFGEIILVSNDIDAGRFAPAVKRLELEIAARDEKIARALALAEQARAEPHPEKALDLYKESESVWHSDEVAQTIRVLSGLLHETREAEARASELYKEAVVLARESKLAEAEEKLSASIALNGTAEAEELLGEVRKGIENDIWMKTLLAQPLELKAVPLIPRVGEKTMIYIEGGAWTADETLAFNWSLAGNAISDEPLLDGRAYSFYPADGQPVTVTMTALRDGSDAVLATRTLSVTAQPREVRIVMNEGARTARLWNTALKRLEETNEIASGTDIELRAEVVPIPEGPVTYLWSAGAEEASVLTVSSDDLGVSRASVRRTSPGTVRAGVTVKDSRGIVLGEGALSILVAVDENDAARDLKRSQAWGLWRSAEELWREKKRLQAIEAATEASLLAPSDPDITHGLSKMKDDLGKMEAASRLLAESSLLIAGGKLDEAGVKIGEAEALRPSEQTVSIRYDLMRAAEKARTGAILAANLRSEGDALLRRGSKEEALLRFQDSLLLSENDAVSRDITALTAEIEAEKALFEEINRLRNEGNALVDARHYAEAVERFERSMSLHPNKPDKYLAGYVEALREMAEREKALAAEAARLRAEGDALMEDKKNAEAVAKYKESLQVWHDESLAIKVKEEEERIAEAAQPRQRRRR